MTAAKVQRLAELLSADLFCRAFACLLSASAWISPSVDAGEIIFMRLNNEAGTVETDRMQALLDRLNAGPPPRTPRDTLLILPSGGNPLRALSHELDRLQAQHPPGEVRALMVSGHSTGDEFFIGEHPGFSRQALIHVFRRRPPNLIPDAVYLLGCYSLTPRQAVAWRQLAGAEFVFGFTRQAPLATQPGNAALLEAVVRAQYTMADHSDSVSLSETLESLAGRRDFGGSGLAAAVCSADDFRDMNGPRSTPQLAIPTSASPVTEPGAICNNAGFRNRTLDAIAAFDHFCRHEPVTLNMRTHYNNFQYAYQCLTESERRLLHAPSPTQFLGTVGTHVNPRVCAGHTGPRRS